MTNTDAPSEIGQAEIGRPAPDREAPALGWLVLVGAIFGLGVLKETLGRIGGPVVRVFPRLPVSLLIAGAAGGLGRIGARVLGFRGGL